jgi:glutathione S-transferase
VLVAPEKALAGRDYLLGTFSAADVLVGATLVWAAGQKLLAGHRPLEDYVRRLKDRPAFQRARKD